MTLAILSMNAARLASASFASTIWSIISRGAHGAPERLLVAVAQLDRARRVLEILLPEEEQEERHVHHDLPAAHRC